MKIFLGEWRMNHFNLPSQSFDAYYTKLSNKLFDQLRFNGIDKRFTEFQQREVAMLIAYYFEDVISDLGLWRTFVTTHKELYGRYLPFYDIDEEEYMLDEINPQDVQFLVWMGVQHFNDDIAISPDNLFLMQLATQLYNILDAEFEKAPVNTQLVEHVFKPDWFIDFLSLKNWFCMLYLGAYILQDPQNGAHEEDTMNVLKPMFGGNEKTLRYATRSILALNSKIGPLSMTIPQWTSRLLRLKGMEREAAMVDSIEFLPITHYLVKEHDAKVITLESLAGGTLTLECSSLNRIPDDIFQYNKMLVASLARSNYSPHWQVCGASSWLPQNPLLMLAQQEEQQNKEKQKMVHDKLLAANNNYPLLYFADYLSMKQFMATHIGLSNDFVETEEVACHKNIVFFIQSDNKFCVFDRYASCIKDDRNPFYDPEGADADALSIILDPDGSSTEMAHYLLEHNMLPDAGIESQRSVERGHELVMQNADFLMRFYRRWKY